MDPDSTFMLRRLQVVAEADLGALVRVLERFQNLNVVPRRVTAELGANDILHIAVDICGVADDRIALIANKVRQVPTIIDAHWCRL
jgi:hypothetical protein